MDLFDATPRETPVTATPAPLADRMRPRALDEVLGQEHLLGAGAVLRSAIETGELHSMILWGPPGSGKTTLARLMAHTAGAPLVAVSAGVSGGEEVPEGVAGAGRGRGRPRAPPDPFGGESPRVKTGPAGALPPPPARGGPLAVG